MSILIKGMEMPQDCQSCRFCFGDICLALKDQETGDCPLIHVNPHGDLIDKNDLYRSIGASGNCNACDNDAYKCQYYREHCLMDFCERIEDAPTIIPEDFAEDINVTIKEEGEDD